MVGSNHPSYIDMADADARREKWAKGTEKYGETFVGHPLLELDAELIDAMNYVAEAERQGWALDGATALLERLRAAVRGMYALWPEPPAKDGPVSIFIEVER